MTEAAGHFCVAAIALGLLVQYARRPLQRTPGQYQVDLFVLWLTVSLVYLAVLSAMKENPYGAAEVLLGSAVMFWLPSALLGAAVLWLARRRALRKGE